LLAYNFNFKLLLTFLVLLHFVLRIVAPKVVSKNRLSFPFHGFSAFLDHECNPKTKRLIIPAVLRRSV